MHASATAFRFAFGRPPAVAADAMVATSQPLDEELDPQAAFDKACFRVEGDAIYLEEGPRDEARELEPRGRRVVLDPDTISFGSGQAILGLGESLVCRADPRKDGYATAL